MANKTMKRPLQMGHLRTQIESGVTISEEDRTVELTFTTGSKGLRRGWDGDYFEELSMDPQHVDMKRLQSGAPLLAAHDAYNLDSVIGVVERAWLEGDKGKAVVRFSADPAADKIFQKVKEKVLRNVSVGYQVRKYQNVSAKEDKVPTYRAVNWEPHEISIVPIGFDPAAQVRSQEITNDVEIFNNLIEDAPKADSKEITMTEEEKRALELAAQKKAELEARKQVEQESRQRILDITDAVRKSGLDNSYALELISQDVTADKARQLIFDKLVEERAKQGEPVKSASPSVEVGLDERDKKREAIVEAVLHRTEGNLFKPTQGNPFLNMSLLRMLEAFHPNRSNLSDGKFATRAMSSSDLPYILANVAEKSAQAKYNLQPKTWSRWATTDTLRNYKTHDKVRSGDFASLIERKENGEFKRGSFGEEREQVALKDYGIILPFTRHMLINDDLGEISKVTSQAGVSAARLENRLVYGVLTGNPTMGDNVALFHSDHGNLAASGAAISDTTIGEAFRYMREQESVDGLDKLNISPKYLICGSVNEILARKYLAQINPTQSSNVNIFSNSLELVVDAEISTNDYFFAADPSQIPTVKLYHLEGEESPRVESRVNFETESVEIKCAHAAAAAPADYRGLYKNDSGS